MNTINACVVFPCGNGGNWLNNLLWHLEHNNTTLSPADDNIVFDTVPKSSLYFTHSFLRSDTGTVYYPRRGRSVLFSTVDRFNIYINHVNKYLYYRTNVQQRSTVNHFYELSNCARFHFYDPEFYREYCTDIEINWSLMVSDPQAFTNQLFTVLDSLQFKYTADADYVLTDIQHYLSTCQATDEIWDNPNSLLWLAACHSVTLNDNLSIRIIEPDMNIQQIAEIMEPTFEYCKQQLEPIVTKWKK